VAAASDPIAGCPGATATGGAGNTSTHADCVTTLPAPWGPENVGSSTVRPRGATEALAIRINAADEIKFFTTTSPYFLTNPVQSTLVNTARTPPRVCRTGRGRLIQSPGERFRRLFLDIAAVLASGSGHSIIGLQDTYILYQAWSESTIAFVALSPALIADVSWAQ